MKTNNLSKNHQNHQWTACRADPKSPHYGYYHCVTCNKFITWIDKKTYYSEKKEQYRTDVMWFGKFQGLPISEVPHDYLAWALNNVKMSDSKKLLINKILESSDK